MKTIVTEAHVRRVVKGARDAGMVIEQVSVAPDGTITLLPKPMGDATKVKGQPDPWE